MQADHAADGAGQGTGVAGDAGHGRPRPGDTVYRPWIGGFDRGSASVQCSIGTVTPCGDWVEVGAVRHPLNVSWYVRRCDAEASVADELKRMADRLMAQAAELRRRAEA